MSNEFQNENNFKYTSLVIKIIALVIAIGVIFISKYIFIFFIASMLPSIVGVMFDRNDNRCASATICTFNLLGVLPFLFQMFKSPSISNAAKIIISDIFTWGIIYTAAFMGQLIFWIFPSLVVKFYLAKSSLKAYQLEQERDKICAEWGIDLDKLADNLNSSKRL